MGVEEGTVPSVAQPPPSAPQEGTVARDLMDESDVFAWAGRIAMLSIGSLVVMIEAARECDKRPDFGTRDKCTSYEAWAVACSTISLALTLFLLVAWKLGMLRSPTFPVPHGELVTAVFFLCLWAAGAGTITTKEPFANEVGNGYLGTWLCFFISAGLAVQKTPQLQSAVSSMASAGTDLAMICCASAVLVLQSSVDCSESDNIVYDNKCSGKLAYALSVGVVSLVAALCGIFFRAHMPPVPFAVFLCLWWSAAWFVVTFFGPYEAIGNGYFSTSIAFIYSVKIVFTIFDLVKFIEKADLYGSSSASENAPRQPRANEASSLVPPPPSETPPVVAFGGGQTEC
eukprot:TRINITY_DN5710_c0_g1_i1.p1 TRINITY_DN5710_c0_g1~~TRINITY_DN5710_c0_g1_i1.p1  ORF type:complete len:343 (+),score=66.32 TRINITY_DN5710_c0_g1_i1:53-1081(+)